MKKIIAVIDPNAPSEIQSVLKDATHDHFDSAKSAMDFLNDLSSVNHSVAAIYSTEQLIDGSGIDFLIRAADIDSDADSLQTIVVGDQAAETVQNIAIKRGITRWISDLDDLRTDLNVTVNDVLEASFLEEEESFANDATEAANELAIVDDSTELSLNNDDIDDLESTELLDDLDDDDDDIFEQTESHSLHASTAIIDATIDDDDLELTSIHDRDASSFEQELIDEDEALSIAEESIRESSEAFLTDADADDSDDLVTDTIADLDDALNTVNTDSTEESISDADLESLESELFGDTDEDDDIAASDDLDADLSETIEESADAESISDEDLEALQALMEAEADTTADNASIADHIEDSIEDISEEIELTLDTEETSESISDDDLESLQAMVAAESEGDDAEAELMREFEALMESGEFEELAAVVDAEEAAADTETPELVADSAPPAASEDASTEDDRNFTYDNINMEDNTYGNLAALVREVSGGEEHELDLPDATTKDIQKMINTRVQDAILDHGTVMLMASKDFTRKYGSQLELELIRHINQLEQRIAELESKLG